MTRSESINRTLRMSDIGPGGCFIDSLAGAREGEEMVFEMKRKDGTNVSIKGEVAYVLPGIGYGVRFIDMNEEQLGLIEEIVGPAVEAAEA